MNYYRRYVGDYLRDTARLSMPEHGAYNLMLDYYYADEKPLPLDKNELYTMLRAMTPADRKAVDKVLATYFTGESDGYHNHRADEEIAVSRTARQNGKLGGRPKTDTGTGGQTGPHTYYITGEETGPETDTGTGQETDQETVDGGGSGHPPTTILQPPSSTPEPPSGQPPGEDAGAQRRGSTTTTTPTGVAPLKKPAARPAKNVESKTAKVAEAYTAAYLERYGVKPLLDAKARSQLSHFIDRVGKDDAPAISAFYVRHNKAFYFSRQHPVGLLLTDAEGLRTQWLNGRVVTSTEARHVDRKQNHAGIAQRLIEKERAKHG